MPYLQQPDVGPAVRYARSDHAIPVPRPSFDRSLGVIDACSSCHQDLVAEEIDRATEAWWGELKPHRPLVDALFDRPPGEVDAAAAERLLRPDLDDPMPQFQALANFMVALPPDVARLEGDAGERLRALARSEDLDIRSLALATLHWARGNDLDARRFLIAALQDTDADAEDGLRRRWSLALELVGNLNRDRGDMESGRSGYLKALEVLPGDADVLESLAVLHNRRGDFRSAAEALRQALAADPERPRTWVNLGVALAELGELGAADEAFREALRLNPMEPLAHLSVGNIAARTDRLDDALDAYLSAVELEAGLAHAQFAAAYLLGQLGRYAEALPHARRAVEFQPNDPNARELLRALEEMGGG
jgi:tetratricopeptide (TPR) repeat protein